MFYRVYPRELCSRGDRGRGSRPGFYRLLFSDLALAEEPLEETRGEWGDLAVVAVHDWYGLPTPRGRGAAPTVGVVDEVGLAGEVHGRLFDRLKVVSFYRTPRIDLPRARRPVKYRTSNHVVAFSVCDSGALMSSPRPSSLR